MKRMKRVVAVILALAVVLGIAGCGKTGKGNGSKSGETFRIVTVRNDSSIPTEFLEEGFMKELEEKMGIDIEWEVYSVNDWATEKNLMLASPDDLPDAFLGSLAISNGDIESYSEQFVELTNLISENMPNLSKILEEDSELKAVMTNREGEIFGLGKRLPFRPASANVPFINKKWLDNLGLEIPTTYKELEAVLQAFKDKDADGDGDPNNEIPYSYCGSLNMDARHILAPFGTVVSRQGNYMGIDKNGEPFYLPITENYKEAVKWMHNLYKKGIIDQEHFTQNSSMLTAKIQASGGSQVGYIFGWTVEAAAGINAKEFVPMVAVSGPDGNRYVESDPSYLDISGTEFIITKNCEKPELLLKWADEFYTDLAGVQSYYGTLGEQIKDNGDGTYTLNPPAGDSSYDYTAWAYSLRDYGPKYVSKEFQEKFVLPTEGGDGLKLSTDVNAEYAIATFPIVKFTEEQASKVGMYSTNLTSYVESMYAEWVVKGGVDAQWDEYISTLKKMGVDEMMKLTMEAYDYYMEQRAE